MSPLLLAIISVLVGSGAIFGALTILKKKSGAGSGQSFTKALGEIDQANADIENLLKSKDSFVGKGQFESIQGVFDKAKSELEAETARLKEIEQKLDAAQKAVETKEAQQQEVKAAKEDDLNKLQELLVNYESISSESIELEQKLAASLKNLDSILGEVQLTANQKAMLTQLQESVTSAGSRLRDLLTEYQTVNERLQMLSQQHSDLEEEYTRLVEQQLGE